jgi:secreted PhoX family phosphatase
MTQISRRRAISILGGSAAGLSLAPLITLQSRSAHAQPGLDPGLGPLAPQYPLNMGELPPELRNIAFIALPNGFSYTAVSVLGGTMTDGHPVPGNHDGMASFPGPLATTLLVRNHELSTGGVAVQVSGGATYDPTMRGGTTNLVIDQQGKLLQHYGSLAGTERNCAGGPTPWGSWLTCEETFSTRNGIRHGYVFEVPSSGISDHVPLRGLGRFNHEAAALDPRTSDVYLTEDRADSLLYRFRPATYGDLRSPGRLEALRLRDWPSGVNTGQGFLDKLFVPLAADWVPIDAFDPDTDTTRVEGQSKGAALFSRGEGAWYADGRIYFCATSGGNIGEGQIFAYNLSNSTLELFVESTDVALLDNPDNITVGPDGRLYLCEDGGSGDNIVSVDRSGALAIVVRNVFNGSEFAGACFSHDGRFMFVNTQSPGLTHVIKGPWYRGGPR